MKTTKEKAIEIAKIMQEFKGEAVLAMDVSQLNSWTDYFVIVTTNSATHSKGLFKQIKDYIKENDLEIMVPKRKIPDGYDWTLVDLGTIVIHLMSEDAREFYNLEKLWHLGETIF
ncbi:MAG TPA: ribosome silencing factor [Treponema sp.]|nr:ribosome silencing factor [Treponema sp.]HPY52897.1 ribosome silencing factor [Treponemataceae bacterium]HQC26525.1 ribosome silencing factor [Treponemataceae bacterium]